MPSVLTIVLPIFALIFAGWAARRLGVLGPQACGELNRFVVFLALPALLFDIVAQGRWSELWRPGFVAAFGLGAALVFAATVALRLRGRRNLADAAIDGLNAAYANTGFIGFPLVLAAVGPAGLTPALIATVLTVCVLFALALVLIEVGLAAERHPARLLAKVAGAVARNPLFVAPAAGALFMATGLAVPAPAESFLSCSARPPRPARWWRWASSWRRSGRRRAPRPATPPPWWR
jgi:predicted permease